MLLSSSFNATRYAQKPLPQPSYNFAHVPKAQPDLRGSTLQHVRNRDDFKVCMAEMLLVCKEAMRRRPGKGTGSKPLSLEYMADRLDIDDPIFGYLVRTQENLNGQAHWQEGMLQGFITVTSFTNWNKSFQWNSLHEAAYDGDSEEMDGERLEGVRKWDRDGSLARQLEGTVRRGDIFNEGIVWPRIAEISLLGGLGCGKALVSLVIEELENMKATDKSNYDYLVLQATDNSIPFYESMGFVRVGAIMKDASNDNERRSSTSEGELGDVEAMEDPSPEKPDALAVPFEIGTGNLRNYTTKRPGETPNDIARQFKVDAWDIVFLNKHVYRDLTISSRLIKGTPLHVPLPVQEGAADATAVTRNPTRWYIAKENETPRSIARKLQLNCMELVEANKARLPGLISSSRLKGDTRVKVSNFDVPDSDMKPYEHWSFPDAEFEDGEPSYMMARKLDRRRGAAAREHPFLSSLAVHVSPYSAPKLLLPASPLPVAAAPGRSGEPFRGSNSARSKPPKRPPAAFMLFTAEQREARADEVEGKPLTEVSKLFSDAWKVLPEREKRKYIAAAEQGRKKYKEELERFKRSNDSQVDSLSEEESSSFCTHEGETQGSNAYGSLYNKVVRLKPGAMTEGSEYIYWYVLTFIPDLKWCHLAPMIQAGAFGPEKPKASGRPKWKLVDESLGKEVDISASFCIPVKSRTMKRTLDADKEEWDIIDDGSPDYGEPRLPPPRQPPESRVKNHEPKGVHFAASTVRSTDRLPAILALIPHSSSPTKVVVVGKSIFDPKYPYPGKRKRGRPKGSKNKPKFEIDPDSIELVRRHSVDSVASNAVARESSEKEYRRSSGRQTRKIETPETKTRNANVSVAEDTTTPTTRAGSRPRRRSAPTYLGESPLLDFASPSVVQVGRRKGTIPKARATPSKNIGKAQLSKRDTGDAGAEGKDSREDSSERKESRSVGEGVRLRNSASKRGPAVECRANTTPVSSSLSRKTESASQGKPELKESRRGPSSNADVSIRSRPRRLAAPSYLGESPPFHSYIRNIIKPSNADGRPRKLLVESASICNIPTQVKTTLAGSKLAATSDALLRPKRKAAPSFLGEMPTKRQRFLAISS